MRADLVLGAVLLSVLSSTPVLGEQEVGSRIDAVTVYSQDGALISRQAQIEVKAGDNAIKLVALPPDIDEDTVRVALLSGQAELGQVRIGTAELSSAFNAQISALQDEIRATQGQLQGVNDANATAKLQLQFLQGIAQGYAKESWFEGARGAADISSWAAALKLLGEGSDDARARIRKNDARAVEWNAQLTRQQRELAVMQGQRRGATEIDLMLRAPQNNRVTLQILYFDEAAGWAPRYEARLDSDSGELELLQRGHVSQQTAEPWRDVALTLSTSQPGGDLEVETLDSWFVDLAKPELAMVKRGRNQNDLASPLQTLRADEVRIEEVVVTGTYVTTSDFDVTYRVPGRVSIGNATDEHAPFDLQTQRYTARLVTRVVPDQVDDAAFLLGRVEHTSQTPLPGAPMHAFLDGAYVGETWMPGLQMGSTQDLPFGQDRRVDVAFRDMGDEQAQTGLVGRRQVESVKNRYTVTNRRDRETQVEVMGRYPVAENEKIRVKILPSATPADVIDYDDFKGVVLWRKVLSAGQQWQIDYQYEISYPKGETLRGH